MNCEKSKLFEWKSELVVPTFGQDVSPMINSTSSGKVSYAVKKPQKSKTSTGKERSKKKVELTYKPFIEKKSREKNGKEEKFVTVIRKFYEKLTVSSVNILYNKSSLYS